MKNYDFKNPAPLPRQEDHYLMWRDDFTHLSDHVLVFGDIHALPTLIECLRHFTSNYICFVSDRFQQDKWVKIRNRYANVLYFEASYSDKHELARTGIESCKHVVLLSWMLPESNHPDSGVLQIIRIIDEHFPAAQYTVEIVDDNNLKFLDKQNAEVVDSSLPFICNTKYASGQVFLSSVLDAIIAQAYFNETLFDVLDKLIFGGTAGSESSIQENCKLNMVVIDAELGGRTTFAQFFQACFDLAGAAVIPIGIYRQPNSLLLGNESPYIITNPDKKCLLIVSPGLTL